jgi:hypothetical protein
MPQVTIRRPFGELDLDDESEKAIFKSFVTWVKEQREKG